MKTKKSTAKCSLRRNDTHVLMRSNFSFCSGLVTFREFRIHHNKNASHTATAKWIFICEKQTHQIYWANSTASARKQFSIFFYCFIYVFVARRQQHRHPSTFFTRWNYLRTSQWKYWDIDGNEMKNSKMRTSIWHMDSDRRRMKWEREESAQKMNDFRSHSIINMCALAVLGLWKSKFKQTQKFFSPSLTLRVFHFLCIIFWSLDCKLRNFAGSTRSRLPTPRARYMAERVYMIIKCLFIFSNGLEGQRRQPPPPKNFVDYPRAIMK